MRTFTYIMCYVSFLILSIAILSKIMHWPGSSSMLVLGYLLSLISGGLMLLYKLKENKEDKVVIAKSKSDNILDA
jgi:cytochrome c biogenesis factor